MATTNARLLPSNHILPDNAFPKYPSHKNRIFPPKFMFEPSPARNDCFTRAVLSIRINPSAHLVAIAEKDYANQGPEMENEVDDYLSMLNLFDRTRNFPYDCKQIHAYFTKLGTIGSNNMVANKLAMYYVKRKGMLHDARKLFDEMPERTLPLYAALISSYGRSKQWEELFSVLGLMVQNGMSPNKYLIPTILKACSAVHLLRSGKMVHGHVIRKELTTDIFVGNALIDLYANCGDLRYSRSVFDIMHETDVVSWTTLVSAYMNAGLLHEAEHIFDLMQSNGVKPDVISWNALVSGFAENGEIDLAIRYLEEMQEKGFNLSVNSWNGLISGCVHSGYFEDALDVFDEMLWFPQNPNVVTIVSILPACAALKALKLGKAIHGYAIKSDLYKNINVDGSLIDMYSKCGNMEYAEKVFIKTENKNTTVWNEMISAYVNEGKMGAAVNLLKSMKNDGVKPNEITYNTLLGEYARNGEKRAAYVLLNEMADMDIKLNIVSFNTLISGFQQSGLTHEALKLFQIMQLPSKFNNGIIDESLFAPTKPNNMTVTGALAACADLNLLCRGKEIHGYVVKNGFEPNVFVSSALVDMYAKCYEIGSAIKIFRKIDERNTVLWNSLIAGHVYNSQPEVALKLFDEMLSEGAEPSSITIMILLVACSEMGALKVGRQLHGHVVKHNKLSERNDKLAIALIKMYVKCTCICDAKSVFYGIFADLEHYKCMVQIMGNAGLLEEALDLIEQMPHVPDYSIWDTLLQACRVHKNAVIEQRVAEALIELERNNVTDS